MCLCVWTGAFLPVGCITFATPFCCVLHRVLSASDALRGPYGKKKKLSHFQLCVNCVYGRFSAADWFCFGVSVGFWCGGPCKLRCKNGAQRRQRRRNACLGWKLTDRPRTGITGSRYVCGIKNNNQKTCCCNMEFSSAREELQQKNPFCYWRIPRKKGRMQLFTAGPLSREGREWEDSCESAPNNSKQAVEHYSSSTDRAHQHFLWVCFCQRARVGPGVVWCVGVTRWHKSHLAKIAKRTGGNTTPLNRNTRTHTHTLAIQTSSSSVCAVPCIGRKRFGRLKDNWKNNGAGPPMFSVFQKDTHLHTERQMLYGCSTIHPWARRPGGFLMDEKFRFFIRLFTWANGSAAARWTRDCHVLVYVAHMLFRTRKKKRWIELQNHSQSSLIRWRPLCVTASYHRIWQCGCFGMSK